MARATWKTTRAIHSPTVTVSASQPRSFRCRISARPMLQTPGMYSDVPIFSFSRDKPERRELETMMAYAASICNCIDAIVGR